MTATQVSQAQILKCTGLHERACLLAFGWFVLNHKSFAKWKVGLNHLVNIMWIQKVYIK